MRTGLFLGVRDRGNDNDAMHTLGARLHLKGNQRGPKEGGLNIGQHEGLDISTNGSKARSKQLLLTTPAPWDPLYDVIYNTVYYSTGMLYFYITQ